MALSWKIQGAVVVLAVGAGCRLAEEGSDANFFWGKPSVAACGSSRQVLETSHFRICYATTGNEAVPSVAYGQELGRSLERAWTVFVGQYGYSRAQRMLGSNGRVEVFVGSTKDATVAGLAFPNGNRKQGSDLQPSQNEAHIFMRHDISDVNNLRHVAAHEFFHLVQFQYMGEFTNFWSAGAWLLEGSAVQSAEEVFRTGIHLGFPGVTSVFSRGNNVSIQMGMEDIYSAATLFQFLHEKYGRPQALREAFENLGLLTTHEAFLTDYISRLPGAPSRAEVFRDYWRWNYFVGSRAGKGIESYSDAASLGPAPFQERSEFTGRLGLSSPQWEKTEDLKRGAAQIFRLVPLASGGAGVTIRHSGNPGCVRGFLVVRRQGESYSVQNLGQPGEEIRVSGFSGSSLVYVDVVLTNGCFDLLDTQKVTVHASL